MALLEDVSLHGKSYTKVLGFPVTNWGFSVILFYLPSSFRPRSPDRVYGGTLCLRRIALPSCRWSTRPLHRWHGHPDRRHTDLHLVGLSIEPTVGDVVIANGAEYAIVAGDPNNYDGVTPVVFVVQGRVVA
jgi:hypothetical protein